MSSLVVLSFLIVFREGLEALLVVAALAAFLIRAGESHRLPALGWGAGLALLASLAVAWVFEGVFASMDELTEAIIMLCVAVLLFHVSAWLWRFRNLRVWQQHLEEKVSGALAGNSSLTLGVIAFLCVFREGAETVLFIYAIVDDAVGAMPAVAMGCAMAAVTLVACYWAMTRMAMKLPLRPLFAVTSLFLFVLGLHFVGEAIHEFQVVGWLPSDPVMLPDWLIGLGVNPSLQALGLQLLLILGAGAVYWLTPGSKISGPDKAA